jgi:sugar O-acyltransferase (sialic acid O-acetyltransferase NeuD family)
MKVSIIGFGDLGKQFLDFLKVENYTDFFLFDDNINKNMSINAFSFNEYISEEFKQTLFFVSLGYKHLSRKHQILIELQSSNKKTPFFKHYTSFVNNSAILENGVFVYPMCNIDKNVTIKTGTLLNNSVVISHDSVIGNCCYLSPGVIVCGNVIIGDYTFIGAGSIISNNITVGKNVIIGIGTVVTKDLPDNTCVIGNPMRIVLNKLIIK